MTKSNNFTTKRTSSSFTSLSNDKNLEDDKNVVKTNGYRGYFSELLSTSNQKNIQLLQPDITKNINLNWNIETKKYSPIVKSYTLPPIDKKNLKNITNYEEYDQNQDESNFTIISEKPKIQKSFYSKPGELPRKIAIERKKRCYKSLNLNELLKELSIDSNQLVPKVSMDISSPFMSEKDTNITFPSYLALEIFDNDDFDCRTPQEWINLGRCTTNNAKDENYSYKPIRAKALLPENVELMNKNVFDENDLKSVRLNWFDVGVFDYNEESKLFTVKRINEKSSGLSTIKRKGDKNTNNKDYFSKTSSKIQRIYLCFSSEDPRIFARRIKHAVNLRSYTEALIRYNLYIDCMPMDGVAEPEPVSMKRILNLAKSVKSLKIENIDDVFKNLENQITIDYCRSMNKIIFDNAVKSKSKQFKFVTLPKIKKKKIPDIATYMDVPVYNFTEIYETFAFNTILTKPEVIQCLFKIKYECDTICNMSLMQTTATKHMRLDEFEQIQSLTTSRVVSFLKEGWINKLTLTIKSCLRDVGKGWYNINQDNHDIYKISKLSKLIEMIKYCMQDSIRYLVMNSLRDYEFLFKEATNCLLDFNESMPWNTDLIFSNFKPNNHTIFYIDLVLEKDNIMFSNQLEDFSRTVIDIINFAIDLTQNIPQLQQLIVVKLFGRVTEYLESVGSKEPFVVAIRERIRNYIHKAVLALIAYSRQYEKYIELSMLNVKKYVDNYESENHTAAQVKEEVELQLKAKIEIENNIPSNIIIGPFLVNTENTRQVLAKKRKSLATSILGVLARKLRNQSDQACNTFKKISQRLYEKPNSIEELDELREWMILVPDKIKEHQDQIDQSVSDYELIEDFCVNLSVDDFNARWTTIGWPNKLELMMSQAEKTLKVDEERFKKAQIQDNANVYNKLDELTMSVAGMSAYTDIGKAHETANEMRRINKQLNETQKLTQTYNNRERLFSLPVTNYDKLKVLMNDFEPYRSLWITVSDWIRTYDSCLDDPLNLIDSETIEKVVNDSYKSLHKSIKHFKNVSDVLDVATTIKNKVQEFKPYIPLLQGLRNPGMRHRHWTELSESIGIPIVPNDSLTFTKCLEMNLQNYVEEISKTAQVAGKEYAIEQALDKMETEWKSIFFEVLPFKETGTCIIKSSEEVSQMLDDHIVMTQGMSFSPFKKPFDDRINNWETKLRITQDVIDEWIFCQKQWLYLEPIFSSEDINLQLPVESKRYQTMDRMWRKIMKNAKDDPMVISLCPDTRLLDNLKECNKLLEQVQKGLSEYLETKRAAFPRFYFLSDDELLEILSQTKDPTAVQPHLRKCFENIAKLEFQDDLQITAMFSGDGERVPFCEKLFPTGNVEDWLLQVERVMKASIRSILEKAINEYSDESRMKWVLMWPGQIVIAGSQLFWTQNVTNWLTKNNLSEGLNMFLKQLDDLRYLVTQDLLPIERQIISPLIVVEVHSREVILKLIEDKVHNINDFEWIKQLRYYWEEKNMSMRIINASFPYEYEYLGNSGRLVITPLTDRCYLTLTGALHLKFGGAPAGPAGTGKTETTKDLAKAFAIQCVVFNCSDQLDYMAMGKFFKGLASSGAWACFDEFNRIYVEVLSVIAQQITTIQKAQQQKVDRFIFEGAEIDLKASCAIFITMNPGYAGRTELPDNLKALFRPVAMMVPDYAMIAEISIFSYGFRDAKNLSKKITITFKLSSEQLSNQNHYDFGMRAVKSVILAAGNLKQQNIDMDESLLTLRAIKDVNVPKFLENDKKLFNGIISDLFPNIDETPIDYGLFYDTLCKVAQENYNLEPIESFIDKCIQLYETTVVRHGLMIVGPTGSGKTMCYQVLRDTMTQLNGEPNPSGSNFKPVQSHVLNPKSITMGQLYGEFDAMTHEWTDGILSYMIRTDVSSQTSDYIWYIFDGPVDAIWIENMNTVLDDNKKLCLASGEIIKLTDVMTMIFEVMDLAVASPATVSRCGMIYLEPSLLGFKPFIDCWLKKIPEIFSKYKEKLQNLFDTYLRNTISFLRENMTEIVSTMDSNLIFSMLNLIDCFFANVVKDENIFLNIPQQRLDRLQDLIEPWFFFSLIWSVGVTSDSLSDRKKFDFWIRNEMKNNNENMMFPEENLVYDYAIDEASIYSPKLEDEEEEEQLLKKEIKWINWIDTIPTYRADPSCKFCDIIVPTSDTTATSFLLKHLLLNNKLVLIVGPTGIGKTLSITNTLANQLPSSYLLEILTFSAKTSVNQTQDTIDNRLDKRRKGVYGPPLGKYCIFFIDDLNMPAPDTFGSQPPIELLRQWSDWKSWYDRKAIGTLRNLVDINFVCAMGRPGAGRNDITPRFLRHFNLIAFTDISVTSKRTIFNKITNWWLQISPKILSISASLVDALIEIHSKITSEMLPTPEKLHYTFNMRDLAKIIQGMTMFDASKHDNINDVYPLWYHESMRVYQDRLINDQDRKFFDEIFESVLFDKFEIKLDDIATNRPLLYGDMYEGTSDSRNYVQMTDHDKILAVVEESLEEFNVTNDIKLDLDIFMYAMEHLCRISRIIRQPFGNALLLGMGGSGRQSLTKLAAYMSDFEIFQINLSKVYGIQEWKEDLQKCMLRAGLQDKQIIFLFSDTQIKNESFLEDLSNILNSGDVPNLYGTDELDQIYTKMKPIALDSGVQPNTTNLFTIFKNRVRSNLHTVIAMSPMGETFRSRLLQFPALVNCCTIDWYSKWPKEALSSVAFKFLSDMEDWKFNNDETNNIVTLFQGIHTSIEDYSQKFLTELSRHNYVTPTSYLQLLNLFSKLKSSILNELTFSKNRTKIGLDKLLHTAKEVKFMQEELAAMKPLLYEAVQESIATMKQITQDTLVAEETKAVVQNEEDQADIQAKETQTIADSAQRDLSEALPALEEALVSLKSLNKNDVVEVRTMQRPPQVVVLVMEAVCIMKQVKPKKVASDKLGQKVDDYWEAGKALLQDPGRFLESLYKYDKENIPDSVISKITPYIMSESFQPSVIKHGSKACTSMCLWVRAMYKYNTVVKTVAPKREALKMAQESLAETQRILDDAKHRLQHIQEGIETLTAKYDECVKKKVDLENKTKLCQDRLVRADKLINGLADERIRWNESVVRLENKLKNILGDIILSAGFITYLGPFTGEYRRMILIDWIAMLKNYNIPYNTDYSFTSTMTDPIQIRNWQLFGLPKDSQSIENAVAVQHSPRWPLFIDPQSQANKWIKNMEKENDIGIIKFTDRDYMRTIENSIRFGKPCLFENVAEELDPAFDPILKKQIYSHSGSKVIKLADNIIPYHEDFKFYITSKNPNPHFSPELSIKVNVINFTISPSGLQDQLLGIVVAEERSDLEDAKNQLIISNSKMKQDLSNIEDKILQKLSQSEGNPVDDVDLIQTLASSKVKSAEIKFKVAASEKTELDIDQTRSLYIPVAVNTQILYFCVADLANIDPMYQYSLEWFIQIFINSIGFSKKSDDIYQRIKNINEYVTFSVYSNVCRSLFEIHKHLFSFMICTRIQLYNDEIDLMEWKFLINGMPYEGDYIENPHPTLISSKVWIDLHNLTVLPVFDGFINSFIKNFNDFKSLLSCSEPESEILTTEWENKLNPFQKMLLIKCLRLDRFTNCVQNYVCKFMGNQFIEPQTAQLDVLFKESSPTIPLVFVLSAGTDPAADLYNFAEKLRFSKKLSAISLGQGQGPRAEALMRSAMERGKWVFFQNCHLAPSWMPNLEKLIEQIDIDKVHRDFRLWLTSTATKDFPVTILQNSSKMTIEPPRGIKANLMRSYMSFTDEYLNSCLDKTTIFKPLLFSLCLFHGVLLERKKFGPLGYNIPYDFTYGDLKICLSQLNMFIMEYDAIPYTVLQYTAGEINYGGRVTDDWDRRLLMNQLFDFYSEKVLTDHHNYTENGIYYQINPSTSDLKSYLDYIKSLPNNDPAEIFGLHENAKISFAQNEAVLLFSYLQKLEPKIVSKQSGSREEGIYQSADKILAMIPPLFDISKIMQKYPILYEQSMNTVLNQEAIRYNNLLEIVKISLIGVKKALKGLIVLDRTLENVVNCIFSNKVPEMWDAKAYPSLKPLYPWITDLIDRIKFIQDWIDYNVPSTYWMSGFFFPQGFLTGTLQNFARREKISIDSISFEFQILDVNYTELKKSPKIGCYIRGLFLEGARWSPEEKCICESKPRILYTDMPVIWLLPKTNRIKPEDGYYECPVYKILTRAGTLNTTGISSNFVFSIEIPSKKPQKHWIQKAAALICALNY